MPLTLLESRLGGVGWNGVGVGFRRSLSGAWDSKFATAAQISYAYCKSAPFDGIAVR